MGTGRPLYYTSLLSRPNRMSLQLNVTSTLRRVGCKVARLLRVLHASLCQNPPVKMILR